ncbi:MAG: hypothetical protein KF845_11965 [Cyclobacteriaceae bacterium]|nr:hypothetical protein [Cyclobacteriaceae bacterium]
MEKSIRFLLVILLGITGCSYKNYTPKINSFKSEEFKNPLNDVYLVDTIRIDSAYVFYKKNENVQFLTNNLSYKKNADQITASIYNNADVFLMSYCFYCHSNLAHINSLYDFENCHKQIIDFENDKMIIYKFQNNQDYFIVALMNIDYYNKKHSTLHGAVFVNADNSKSAYIRVAFPFCSAQ